MMIATFAIAGILLLLTVLFSVSLGQSIMLFRLRREENRKRAIEQEILKRRTEIITRGEKVAHNLEELLYQAQVKKQIDDITRRGE